MIVADFMAAAREVCPWHHVGPFCVHCEAIAAALLAAYRRGAFAGRP